MKSVIRPIGLLKIYCRDRLDSEQSIEIDDLNGWRLKVICRELELPVTLISHYIVNGELRSGDYVLQPGDDVKCLAVIGGG